MNDLIREAVQLRQTQANKEKRIFLSYPRHLQNTLFHGDEIATTRALSFDERMSVADAKKRQAGEKFREAKLLHDDDVSRRRGFMEASRLYEEAYSVFSCLRPLHPMWKERGLRDEDMEHVNFFEPEASSAAGAVPVPNTRELQRVTELFLSVLCSYSIVAKEEGDVEAARRALEEAMRISAHSVRPAFLLAKLLSSGATCTTVDLEKAVSVLEHAVTFQQAAGAEVLQRPSPDTHAMEECKELLRSLQSELRTIDQRDRKTFRKVVQQGGMAPSPATAADAEHQSPPALLGGTWYAQAEQARRVISQMRVNGDVESSESLDRQLREAAAEKLFVEHLRPARIFDFECIPESTLKHAQQALGIDVCHDTVVQEKLAQLRHRYYVDEEVDLLSPFDVDLMLLEAGVIAPSDLAVCATNSTGLPDALNSSRIVLEHRALLKKLRRSRTRV